MKTQDFGVQTSPVISKWSHFTTETGLKAAWRIDDYGEVCIRLISKVPRGYYYSCLNEAGAHFDEHIKPSLT